MSEFAYVVTQYNAEGEETVWVYPANVEGIEKRIIELAQSGIIQVRRVTVILGDDNPNDVQAV